MHKLAPAFVVTFSAVYTTACGTQEVPGNPTRVAPEPGPTSTIAIPEEAASEETAADGSDADRASGSDGPAGATPSATVSATPPRQGTLNPSTVDGRSIMVAYQGPGCFVYLDFPALRPGEQRPPGTAPPTKNVACPAVMSDPAFQACRGGLVQGKGDGCVCFVSGNPPRVQPSPCPAK